MFAKNEKLIYFFKFRSIRICYNSDVFKSFFKGAQDVKREKLFFIS